MKYCQHKLNFQEDPVTLEITEFQITNLDNSRKNKYSSSLNHRVSRNHRNYGAVFQSNLSSPKTCSISNPNSTDNAFSILVTSQ